MDETSSCMNTVYIRFNYHCAVQLCKQRGQKPLQTCFANWMAKGDFWCWQSICWFSKSIKYLSSIIQSCLLERQNSCNPIFLQTNKQTNKLVVIEIITQIHLLFNSSLTYNQINLPRIKLQQFNKSEIFYIILNKSKYNSHNWCQETLQLENWAQNKVSWFLSFFIVFSGFPHGVLWKFKRNPRKIHWTEQIILFYIYLHWEHSKVFKDLA